MASPIIGLLVFWAAIFIALVVVNVRTKLQLTVEQQEVKRSDAAPSSVTFFVDNLGNRWELTNATGVLQYIWTAVGQSPRVLWDSINFACGPNVANYAAYEAAFPSGPSYLAQDSLNLGITPESTNASGSVVSFRLVLYQGDVRIESLVDNSFWSIFAQPVQIPLTSWPSTGDRVIWQSLNTTLNLAAQFLANGDLVTKQVNQVNTYWSASLLQSPNPCV